MKKIGVRATEWLGGKNAALKITGCFVLCGLLWSVFGILFLHTQATDWAEDLPYIVFSALIIYFLTSRTHGAIRAKESALRESEDRLARILETNASGIVVCDEQERITFANHAAERILGLERGSMIGLRNDDPAWELSDIDGSPLPRERSPIGQVQATRMPVYDCQIGVRRRDGVRVFLTVNAAPLLDASGKMVGIVASFADITGTKKAEALKLRKLLLAVEQGPTAIVITDPEGTVEYVNPRYTFMTGYGSREAIGNLLPCRNDIDTSVREEIFTTLRAGQTWRGEFRCLRKNREPYWEYTSVSPVRTEEGVTTSLLWVRDDITVRKRAEEALQQSEEKYRSSQERFRQLFEQNEEPLFLFRSGSDEIVDVNAAAEKLYGLSREDLIRSGLPLFVPKGELQGFAEAIACIRPGSGLSVERVEHIRTDGSRMIVSVRGKSVRLESGHVSYCSFRDITARVRMEEEARLQQAQLIHANRMASLGTIVSGVAHEVNNPNNLIMFNAPMILSAWEDAVPVLEAHLRENGDFPLGGLPYSEMREVVPRLAAGISDASARIKTIVSNLKDFARQDRSRGHAPVNLNDAVRAAVSIMNHEIIKATHRFGTSFAEDLPPVSGSTQELEQVVVNLLNNALQALPSNRRGVTVATRRDPDTGEVVVEVADEGTGMSPEVLGRIAEPFFSTRMDSGGLGLGLSISRSILKEHGGSLSFESEVGKGTRVIVRLPAIGAGREPAPGRAASIASLGG